MPPNFATIFFTRSIPFVTPLDSVCAIRSIAGWSLFTSAWSLSNALVRNPVSLVMFWSHFVTPCTSVLRSFNTCTAGLRNTFPAAAFKSLTDCFKFPSWLDQVSDSLAACPSAPEALFASSTIDNSVNCFSASLKSLNDFPYRLFAAVFLVVSVHESPRAASFSKFPFKNDCKEFVTSSMDRS